MPDLLGATNPVPGYDNSIPNRNIPVSPDNTQIQNVPDPSKVVRADRRTEQQDSGQQNAGNVRYDSNFQAFLQRLRETPNLAQSLSRLFITREGTVVSSGLTAGVAAEMAKALEMIQVDQGALEQFLLSQLQAGTCLGGPMFALLRSAYARAASDSVRSDILSFVKSYMDWSDSGHIGGNLLRNVQGMADAMPASWGDKLREVAAELANALDAGDRKGVMELLRQRVIPFMSSYVGHTHDVGRARGLLSLMTLDMARYENGSEEKLLEDFHRLSSYGTLKEQLGAVDDASLLKLLERSQFKPSAATQFSDHLAQAAAHALRGDGSAETQEIFSQLVRAMLVNESVYMPVNHLLVPLEMDGRLLFSELWVDPDDDSSKQNGRGGGGTKLLLKMDVQDLGLFDLVLATRDRDVSIRIACPDKAAPFTKEIEQSVSQIVARCGLTPKEVTVRKMERPVALTEVFPQIFEGMNSINVKV